MLMLLALGNATAKCKGYLAFQAPKCIASRNAICKHCRINYGDWENIILLCRYIILMSRIEK